MSYFIPRPRGISLKLGLLENVDWSKTVKIDFTLAPSDIFGVATETTRHSFFPEHKDNLLKWDVNVGKFVFESKIFFSPLNYSQKLNKLTFSFNGNILTVEGVYSNFDELCDDLSIIEHQLTSYLSLFFNAFVRVEKIVCNLAPDIIFNYQLLNLNATFLIATEGYRLKQFSKAIELMGIGGNSVERFALASIYYQQAMRLNDINESEIPSQNFAEMFLNLAKSIELLFTTNRDKLREKCREIGYTNDEIESKIVPILVIRNKLDIAHSAGRRISTEDIVTIREYGYQALKNVRAILITISNHLLNGNDLLKSVSAKPNNEVRELCNKLRDYNKQPELASKEITSNYQKTNSLERRFMESNYPEGKIGYFVYRTTDPNLPKDQWTRVNETPTLETHLDQFDLEPDTEYFIYITSVFVVDGKPVGAESAPSSVMSARASKQKV